MATYGPLRWTPRQAGFPFPLVETSIDGTTIVIEINTADWTIQKLTITANEGSDINSATLRRIKLGELRSLIYTQVRDNPSRLDVNAAIFDQLERFKPRALSRLSERDRLLLESGRRRVRRSVVTLPKMGRGASNADFHKQLAIDYLNLLETNPQKPIAALAAERRRPRNTVSAWVRKAREEGWLTKSSQGKAGGGPGPKLVAWLDEQEELARR